MAKEELAAAKADVKAAAKAEKEALHEVAEAKKNEAKQASADQKAALKAKKELATYVKEYSKEIYNNYIGQLDDEARYIEEAIKIVAVVAEESRIQKIKSDATTALLNAKPTEVKVDDEPKEPEVVSKSELLEAATLKTKGEVDQYLEKLKSKLYQYISKNGIDIK